MVKLSRKLLMSNLDFFWQRKLVEARSGQGPQVWHRYWVILNILSRVVSLWVFILLLFLSCLYVMYTLVNKLL